MSDVDMATGMLLAYVISVWAYGAVLMGRRVWRRVDRKVWWKVALAIVVVALWPMILFSERGKG